MTNKLFENIGENQYYKENKYDENADKVSLHLRISPAIANDFVKTIAVYRDYGIDKRELTKSELGAIIISDFVGNLADDDTAILNIISKVKAYRDNTADGGDDIGEC